MALAAPRHPAQHHHPGPDSAKGSSHSIALECVQMQGVEGTWL
jgi:hypothetical protein